MKKIIIAGLLMVSMFTNKAAFAQTKLAVVGVDEVFAVMPETKKADSLLASFQKDLADNFNDLQKELNSAIEKFYKDSINMSVSLKNLKRTDLQSRITELSKKERQNNGAVELEKEKQLKPIREKLVKAIQDVAKENGYTHVAYKDQLLVFPVADDITDKVKKKLGINK